MTEQVETRPPLSATANGHSPTLRNTVHAGAFLVWLWPLGYLADPRNGIYAGPFAVAGFLLAVTVFNILVLPRLPLGKRITRPGEGFVNGQWLYPLSLAIAFAVFPPYAAMAGWAAMAGGDAAASFIGQRIPQPKLPWNRRKSWAGLVAFICLAIAFAFVALWWCPCPLFLKRSLAPEWPYVWTLAVIAAVAGAVLESLDTALDDNLRVPLGVGAVVWGVATFLSFGTRDLPRETHVQPEVLLHALVVNGALGAAVLALRFASWSGTALGVLLGVIVYFFTQSAGYALFLIFVICGCALSRLERVRKEALGTAEADGGRRGIGNVAANLLVPVGCCLLYPLSGGHPAFLLAYAGALAAAFADTASSEIGCLARRAPVLITTLKPVPHGTNGAVTALGTVAAFLAAVLIAGAGWALGFWGIVLGAPSRIAPVPGLGLSLIVIVAGMAGTIIDSVLGATVEDRVPGVGKGAVNFACTLAGAIVAGLGLAIWRVL